MVAESHFSSRLVVEYSTSEHLVREVSKPDSQPPSLFLEKRKCTSVLAAIVEKLISVSLIESIDIKNLA